MVNVFTNTKQLQFTSIEIFINKKFRPLALNAIFKYTSSIIKLDGKIYATDNLTIVSTSSAIDLLLEQELQTTAPQVASHGKTIKNIKRLIASYESKFQFGLLQVDLEMLSVAKGALEKYKMLAKLKLQLTKGEIDD